MDVSRSKTRVNLSSFALILAWVASLKCPCRAEMLMTTRSLLGKRCRLGCYRVHSNGPVPGGQRMMQRQRCPRLATCRPNPHLPLPLGEGRGEGEPGTLFALAL